MKTKLFKQAAFLCASVLSLGAFAACGGEGGGGSSSDVTTIRVDLHGWTPTINSTSTGTSIAYNSPKYIAKEFEELHENKVKIEWVRDKNLNMDEKDAGEYFSLAIENKTCPSIAFTWGTTFQDRDWYIDLTSYLEETNSYETATDLAGKKWKESFEDYIWNLKGISTYSGKIVAVPLTVFVGSASAVYYNTAKLAGAGYIENANPTTIDQYELGMEGLEFDWTTWMEVVNAAKTENAKYVVDSENYPFTAASWLMQFNLGPAYMSYTTQFVDTNNDGEMSGTEILQGVVDGLFNPEKQPYAQELLQKCKEYLSLLNEHNLDAQEWNNGNGWVSHKGSFAYTPEVNANNSFNWEMVPGPVEDDSQYTKNYVNWVSLDETKPNVDLYLNVMKAGVTKDGTITGEIDQNKLYYSVEFLKYLTTREANSAMIDEMNTSLGAVKGADKPMWLSESAYANCRFPQTTCVNGWPTGFTMTYNTQLDTILSAWVKGTYGKSDAEFYTEWNSIQVAGAQEMAQKVGITLH